jgi:ribonuclease HII
LRASRGISLSGLPTLLEEQALISQGYQFIAGVDEVGRGALAGPVVAAAVILPPDVNRESLCQVRDSKEVLPVKRELLCPVIRREAVSVSIGIIPSWIVDQVGIVKATRLAMITAITQLSNTPEFLLIDGMEIPELQILQRRIIKGDKRCLSIACASIIAKVTRDSIMVELNGYYPGYGFAFHKGYGTDYHLLCLNKRGPSPIHRHSFSPVKQVSDII